jgi:predicted PurR-regulated permease PerM
MANEGKNGMDATGRPAGQPESSEPCRPESAPPVVITHANSQPLVKAFMLALVLLALGLSLAILLPFINPILLAIILASLVHPVFTRIERRMPGRRNTAALITVIGTALVIVLPVLIFLLTLVSQAAAYVQFLTGWIESGGLKELLNHQWLVYAGNWVRLHITGYGGGSDMSQAILTMSQKSSAVLLEKGAGLVGNAINIVASFFIMLFLLFYLVRDGRSLLRSLKDLVPLREEQENRIISKIRLVARATLLGTFVTALIQGIAGGIGLSIVGIPGVFWGTVLGIASLVPVIGTGLVGIPAVVYLLLAGRWQAAIFLGLWMALIVGTIDNYVRPVLMHERVEMSTFFVFLGIIGGLALFGIPGLLYGPLIMGFAAVMLYIFRVEYAPYWR